MREDATYDIAVVGGGISGLSAAWLLAGRHRVTLFEADERIGGHSHTVMVGDTPVDTGFIVYNEATYPNLTALFAHLDVPTKHAEMSFAVSLDDGRLEYSGTDLGGLLTLDWRPQRELSLSLQRRRLIAQSTDDHHVAIEAEDLVAIQGGLVLGVLNALAFGRQQLD